MFFVSMFECLPEKETKKNIGATWCVGYFEELNEANEVITKNTMNIYDGLYEYGVIENIPSGLQKKAYPRWFYKYNHMTNRYDAIEEPTELRHQTNIAMG